MAEPSCENVRIASMAREDGFAPLLSPAQIETHLATCADCRREVQQMVGLTGLLGMAQRSERYEQLWPLIEQRLEGLAAAHKGRFDWRPFLLLGLLLAGYKVILMATPHEFGFWFKLIPLALVVAAFAYVNENPFKINSDLRLTGETS